VGSEFKSLMKNSAGQTIILRITDLQGIARSKAEVTSQPGTKVAAGEIFELAKWIWCKAIWFARTQTLISLWKPGPRALLAASPTQPCASA